MTDATALIRVDLQAGAFGGHGIPAVDRPDRLLGNARALLQAARAAGEIVTLRRTDALVQSLRP